MSYPKHICYRQGGAWGKQMHAVARSEEDEEAIREMIATRGHKITCCQPIEQMEEGARRQFIEVQDIGFRKTYRDTESTSAGEPELPF
jgi:hypothetical protein